MRGWRQSVGVAALLALLTALLTWPLVSRLDSAVADLGDPVLTSWILAWDIHALREVPLRLFDANIFHPHRWTLAYTEHLLGLVPLAAPARLAGASPVFANNVVLWLTFPLAGLTMFALVRHLTGHAGAATVSAILYAFAHYRFGQLSHVQLLSHQWLPLLLLGLHRTVSEHARWRDVALAALAFTLQALSSGYYAYVSAVVVAVFLVWVAAPAGRPPLGRLVRRGAVAGALTACLLVPLSLPYAVVRRDVGLVRGLDEVGLYSAQPEAYLAAPAQNRWLGTLTAAYRRPDGALFPGVIMLVLAGTGTVMSVVRSRVTEDAGTNPRARVPPGSRGWPRWLDWALAGLTLVTVANVLAVGGFSLHLGGLRIAQRRVGPTLALIGLALLVRRLVRGRPAPLAGLGWLRRLGWPAAPGLYLMLTAVGLLCSFGPTLVLADRITLRPVYAQLYRVIPGFDALRAPGRFAVLVITGLAVLAGYGAAAIARRLRRPGLRLATLVLLGGLAAAEAWGAPIPFVGAPPEPGPADRWLAAAPGPGAVVVLPLYEGGAVFLESLRLLGSTAHWRPLVNGYAGTAPPDYLETVATLNTFPSGPAVARLHALYVRYVVVYLGQYRGEARGQMEAALEALPPGVTRVATLENTAILEVGSPPPP